MTSTSRRRKDFKANVSDFFRKISHQPPASHQRKSGLPSQISSQTPEVGGNLQSGRAPSGNYDVMGLFLQAFFDMSLRLEQLLYGLHRKYPGVTGNR